MIRIFVNVYRDPHLGRNGELLECLLRNQNNRAVDEVVRIGGRPTYENFFARVNEIVGPDNISVICNSDIYFDETLAAVEAIEEEQCYALSRWEIQSNGTGIMYPKDDSGDAWCFRGQIKPVKANFTLGLCGCDNAVACRISQAGYTVLNPAKSIRANHLHVSAVRRYDRVIDRVAGPYLLISPHEIGEQPNYRGNFASRLTTIA